MRPGELSFVRLRLHNQSKQREVFTVVINDPDEAVLFEKEI